MREMGSLPGLTAQMLRPSPALREAHFWCIFPEEVDAALLKSYEKFLSPEEQEDMTKVRTEKMQTGRLLARTLVRTTLARYACGHVDPASLMFKKNGFGKPQVIWPKLNTKGELWRPPNLSFNLSHTDSLIACGVSLDSAIGIDVEEKNRKLTSNLIKFARGRFSSKEADWLQSFADSDEQHQQFMRLWTLKEAYVKAVGKGISGVPFKDFSFHLKASPVAHELLRKVTQLPVDPQAKSIILDLAGQALERERPASSWQFLLFQPGPAHVASICIEDRLHDTAEEKMHYKVQTWKTVPLISDQHLSEGAIGLGVSNDYSHQT
ncbi:unnamed protein product [Calypogeia fissa]